MEKTIANKMTFYDIVTLIVPGALIYCAYDYPKISCSVIWISYLAQFGIILMVGLLLKGFGAWWANCWFRNNTDIIQEEKEKQIEDDDKFSWCSFLHTWICAPIRFIFGPFIKLSQLYLKDKAKLKDYIKQYTKAYNDSYSGKRIEILESHVAFLQTWIWALVVCLFKPTCEIKCTCGCGCVCCSDWNKGIITIAIYICIVVMLAIQRKIYNVVWEYQEEQHEEAKNEK